MIQTTAPALLAAVNGASSKIKPAGYSMTALEHVAIDSRAVVATDLDLEGVQRYAATGDEAEVFYLQRAALKRILSKIGDAAIVLTAAESGDALVTLANGSSFTLAQLPVADYPKAMPAPADGISLEVPAATLRNMLERALVAASKDESRPVLTSLCLEVHPDGFAIVSTDSYRLHVLEHGSLEAGDGQRALLPRRFAEAVVERIKKLKPELVTITSDYFGAGNGARGTDERAHARVTIGDWTGTARLVSGQFPNFRQLFPDNAAATAILPAAAMMSAIDMAEAVGARSNATLRLTLGAESSLTLDSKMGAAFTAPLNILYEQVDDADDMTIGYNGVFLADMIGAAQSDSPILSLISPLRPSWITSVGCAQCGTPIDGYGVSFRGLLMPIRIG